MRHAMESKIFNYVIIAIIIIEKRMMARRRMEATIAATATTMLQAAPFPKLPTEVWTPAKVNTIATALLS